MIVVRIIDEEGFFFYECFLLYVCDGLNDKIYFFFVRLFFFMKYVKLIYRVRSLFGVRRMRKFILSIGNVDEIYVVCIDDSFVYYVISFIKGVIIKMFDDGIVNIIFFSRYFIGCFGLGFRLVLLKVFYFINGNRYNFDLVKVELVLYYLIYKDFDNVMNNVKYI